MIKCTTAAHGWAYGAWGLHGCGFEDNNGPHVPRSHFVAAFFAFLCIIKDDFYEIESPEGMFSMLCEQCRRGMLLCDWLSWLRSKILFGDVAACAGYETGNYFVLLWRQQGGKLVDTYESWWWSSSYVIVCFVSPTSTRNLTHITRYLAQWQMHPALQLTSTFLNQPWWLLLHIVASPSPCTYYHL
jgi:hypothetical protein